MSRILDTYRSAPPTGFGDVGVAQFQDFGREQIRDEDGVVRLTERTVSWAGYVRLAFDEITQLVRAAVS